MAITKRQQQLLQAIINEFIETANAVGSVSLRDKYRFNVSPATVRNEMAELVRQGYLAKQHSSAGRVPTTQGLRYFLQELLNELDEPDVVTKEQWKQQMHQDRFQQELLIKQALNFLTSISGNAAVAVVGQQIHYSGLRAILDIPEFSHLDKLKSLMTILEDYSSLVSMFEHASTDDKVKVLIGEETGLNDFDNYAVVFSNIRLHGKLQGYIAVIGPYRMNYSKVIPAVEFASNTISNLVKGW